MALGGVDGKEGRWNDRFCDRRRSADAAVACGGIGGSKPGVTYTLEPDFGEQASDIETALGAAKAVLEQRLEGFDVDDAECEKVTGNQIELRVPETITEDTIDQLSWRGGRLEFCEPVTNSNGQVLVVSSPEAKAQYEPQTCLPIRDASGNVVVDGGSAAFIDIDR